MNEFNRYSSIGQYRNALKCMQYHGIEELQYIGATKIHGTNSAIRFTNTDGILLQSRNRNISVEDDNAGFAKFVYDMQRDDLNKIFPDRWNGEDTTIYGEFAGEGIQKGVDVNSLPKSFFIFDVKIDGQWLAAEDVAQYGLQMQRYNIYNIYSFPTFFQKVRADAPMEAQAVFASLTQAVEDECPVAYTLCDNDDEKIGEGIVWKPVNREWRQIPDLCFKTKGVVGL